MTSDTIERVVETVVQIQAVAKQLGCSTDLSAGDVRDLTVAVAELERKPMKAQIDHEKLALSLDAVRESKGISTQSGYAEAIGISPQVLASIYAGKPVNSESLVKLVAYTQIDLRKYIAVIAIA